MHSRDTTATELQWSAGGWFGGVLGSSAWMLVCAIFLLSDGQSVAAWINIACFTIVNLAGTALWFTRRNVSPVSGLLILSSVLAFAIPTAWMTTTHLASDASLEAMNWPTSTAVTAAVLFAAPAFSAFILWRQSRLNSLTKLEKAG